MNPFTVLILDLAVIAALVDFSDIDLHSSMSLFIFDFFVCNFIISDFNSVIVTSSCFIIDSNLDLDADKFTIPCTNSSNFLEFFLILSLE